ncbi:MAG: PD-(D/E)XK nuclease family protein [Acidobacteria bacterium]|nr:PD-(D/E)XK nuclease family protein [Acidobacteriota bacterium]
MTERGELRNEFSWSRSRDAVFSECRRRYFYQYYGSWGGWRPDADPRTREIYILKQLTGRQAWAGSAVHRCIERSLENLRSGVEPLPVDAIVALTLDGMRQEWKRSRAGIYRDQPKSLGLFEHEYAVPVPDEEWKATAAHVEACLRNFYASEVYGALRRLPRADWLEVEEFSHFLLDGVKVHVKLDCSCRRDGAVWIYDWKTSRRDDEENTVQLACYALYAREKWRVEPEALRVGEFSLPRNRLVEYRVGGGDLDRVRDYILGSIRDMRTLLPPDGANSVDPEACPLTEERWRCTTCNFKRLCDR